jgi:hypothetical protein
MEVALDSDFYTPNINLEGNYVDKIPNFQIHKNGVRCPCSSKVYTSYATFSSHIKTKMHQKWIEEINLNKDNFFVENQKLKETVANQQKIIQKLEIDCQHNKITIETLSRQVSGSSFGANVTLADLLDFD